MYRRLIVLRHAKSDQYSDAPTDHDRPLNPRGLKSAPLVAARLVELGWVPEAVVSSDAERTRQTWTCMRETFGGQPQLRFTRSLYLAGPPEVRQELSDLPGEVRTAMVVGHNPGWEDVVTELSGVRVRMTTCNAAMLEVEAESWAEAVKRPDWTLHSVLRPKEL